MVVVVDIRTSVVVVVVVVDIVIVVVVVVVGIFGEVPHGSCIAARSWRGAVGLYGA